MTILTRIAIVRAGNLAHWNALQILGGTVSRRKPKFVDRRVWQIQEALKADKRQAKRLLWRILRGDLRVCVYTLAVICGF